jgi:putative heme-binding domain-containing protein
MVSSELLVTLLDDPAASVRITAAAAAGKLQVRSASAPLLRLATDADPQVRRASLVALRLLKEPKAVPLAARALADRTTQLAALECLAALGGPDHAAAIIDAARQDPTDAVVLLAAKALTKWSAQAELPQPQRDALDRAVSVLQASSGLLVRWHVAGPLSQAEADKLREQLTGPSALDAAQWKTLLAEGLEARVRLAGSAPDVWLAAIDVTAAEAAPAQFLAAASGKYEVWLNGKSTFRRDEPRAYQPESDRFEAEVSAGDNRLVLQLTSSEAAAQFHLRFRRKSSAAEVEKLVQAALTRKGDPSRGRIVFFDAKSQCSKCHRLGDAGERIGPELTGIGGRFSRIHLIESILEPSRAVTPGFQTLSVRLVDGRVLSGIRVAETDAELTLADQQGQKHVLPKAEIDAQQPQAKSTMPDNLAQQLTAQQFSDLVAFLAGQK